MRSTINAYGLLRNAAKRSVRSGERAINTSARGHKWENHMYSALGSPPLIEDQKLEYITFYSIIST
ncbi:hypothetical protein GCM10008014_45120 [Paenibacillus silvae]|uniref:Uncharacterized protein n=1 Tax=Paenibacillus silvae TaxID=1325358 RepID=A0ABQ1ZJP1_9BACL|nr:hypothetical protein GCM10008014_45120 [Paenibacillus silvae]